MAETWVLVLTTVLQVFYRRAAHLNCGLLGEPCVCVSASVYFVCTCVLALRIPTCVCVYLSKYLCTWIILCVHNLVCFRGVCVQV